MTVSRPHKAAAAVTCLLFVGLAAGVTATVTSQPGSPQYPRSAAPGAAPATPGNAPSGSSPSSPSGALGCDNGPSGLSGVTGASGGGASGASATSESSTSSTTAISPHAQRIAAKVDRDLVDVDTVLAYDDAVGAGTGIVLRPDGVVLTNNHVIRDATSVKVTDVHNNRTYSATVLGYDLGADVAVVALRRASGLETAPLGDSSKVTKGTPVVALGNACGAGGTPSVATGKVLALAQSIVAEDSLLGPERLSGLIETSAPLQPGDSGGSLVDQDTSRVIGMDTAGSQGFSLQSGAAAGFAVPISTAVSIAQRIETGRASASVHVGPTAFLGVVVQNRRYAGTSGRSERGVAVAAVVTGTPAAKAGMSSGDVLIELGGRKVSSPAAITDELLTRRPGSTVTLRWIAPDGTSHQATVRLISGPAQ